MKNLEMQLKALEVIEGCPVPLDWIPPTTIEDDGTVLIPGVVMRYLEKQGERVELDKNGRIGHKEYHLLLTKHNLGVGQIIFICYSDDPEDENIESVLSHEHLKMLQS